MLNPPATVESGLLPNLLYHICSIFRHVRVWKSRYVLGRRLKICVGWVQHFHPYRWDGFLFGFFFCHWAVASIRVWLYPGHHYPPLHSHFEHWIRQLPPFGCGFMLVRTGSGDVRPLIQVAVSGTGLTLLKWEQWQYVMLVDADAPHLGHRGLEWAGHWLGGGHSWQRVKKQNSIHPAIFSYWYTIYLPGTVSWQFSVCTGCCPEHSAPLHSGNSK